MALQGLTPGVTGRKPQCRVGSGVSGKHGLSACSREELEVKASQEGSTAIWGPELSRTEGEMGTKVSQAVLSGSSWFLHWVIQPVVTNCLPRAGRTEAPLF